MGVTVTALVDCEACGATYEASWFDVADTAQDMDGAPTREMACPNCGHVQTETYPGWVNRTEAG